MQVYSPAKRTQAADPDPCRSIGRDRWARGLRPSRKRQSYGGRNTRPRTQAGAIRRRCWKGAVVALEIINPDPRYSKVHLIETAPLGYLHLAADVQAPHRPGPVLRRGRPKLQLLGVLKWQARQLAQLDTVERATVYDALAFTPPGGYVKGRPAPLPLAWFVVVLVETTSPRAASEVRAAPPYQALVEALTEQARRVHHVAARNVRLVGDVDKTPRACSCSTTSPVTTPAWRSSCGTTSPAGMRPRPARTTPPCSRRSRAKRPST
jgi:hypothetical protein